MFNITGTIKLIKEEQQISDRFKKREFVLTDNSSQYPQHILFQLTQDKCNLIDPYKTGDEIKVFFNLRGREWQARDGEIKYFNSLEAWKLEAMNQGNTANSEVPPPPISADDSFLSSTEEDDLPF